MRVSPDVARRLLLGRQGLWPGRRWSSAADALRALESVQIDPMTVVARSHDQVLWNRVDGYQPADLDALLYQQRSFFEYGAHLDIYPIAELPMWDVHMQRRKVERRWSTFAQEHAQAIEVVRAAVRAQGPLGTRDVEGDKGISSYRGGKDTGVALYYLWLIGELMTHSRRRGDRLYDLRERVAPPEHDHAADEPTAARHFARKALRHLGMCTPRAWGDEVRYALYKTPADRTLLTDQVTSGEAITLTVDGVKATYYAPADVVPVLDELGAGKIPDGWQPVGTTTEQEVMLLSPLDNLLHNRERTLAVFEFEYLWEVYKPAHLRRWGRYTMPVLYGDRLVARIEPRLNRRTSTLELEQMWFEEPSLQHDPRFTAALNAGLARFAESLSAKLVL